MKGKKKKKRDGRGGRKRERWGFKLPNLYRFLYEGYGLPVSRNKGERGGKRKKKKKKEK